MKSILETLLSAFLVFAPAFFILRSSRGNGRQRITWAACGLAGAVAAYLAAGGLSMVGRPADGTMNWSASLMLVAMGAVYVIPWVTYGMFATKHVRVPQGSAAPPAARVANVRWFHVLSFVAAMFVGYFLWGLSIAGLPDDVGPLGKGRTADLIQFCIPVAAFSIPLSLIASTRGHWVTGGWLVATAPLFGILNFAFVLLIGLFGLHETADARMAATSTMLGMLAVWLVLLALVIRVCRPGRAGGDEAAGAARRGTLT